MTKCQRAGFCRGAVDLGGVVGQAVKSAAVAQSDVPSLCVLTVFVQLYGVRFV